MRVDYYTVAVSASSSDYQHTTGLYITVPALATSASIVILVNGDTAPEVDERFDVVIDSVSVVDRDVELGSQNKAAGLIENDD